MSRIVIPGAGVCGLAGGALAVARKRHVLIADEGDPNVGGRRA